MAVDSPCKSDASSIGCADLEYMLQMPNPFKAPLTAEERELLTLDSEGSSDTSLPLEAQHTLPSTSQAALHLLRASTSPKRDGIGA
eukprot:533242-Pleurochrysis_carterae.AAC.1